jgi:hypothetical protein
MRATLPVLAVGLASIVIAPVVAGQQPLGRYETTECFQQIRATTANLSLECGWLTLPEIRSKPDGPTVRLAVVRYRARNPTSLPLVFLHGGPGVPWPRASTRCGSSSRKAARNAISGRLGLRTAPSKPPSGATYPRWSSRANSTSVRRWTRSIKFIGTLKGDTIDFVREVEAPAGSPAAQGAGIFGLAGARAFTATRIP